MKLYKFNFLALLIIVLALTGCVNFSPTVLIAPENISIEMVGKNSENIDLIVSPVNGFKGKVEFFLDDNNFTLNNSTNVVIDVISIKKISLKIEKKDSTLPGNYSLNLKARIGNSTKNVNLNVSIRDIEIIPYATSINITRDSETEFLLGIKSYNEFNGNIKLYFEDENGLPFSYVTVEPSYVKIDKESTSTFLKLKVNPNIPNRKYNLKLVAISEKFEIIKKSDFVINVLEGNEPSFTIESDTEKLNIEQGNSGKVQITITPENGFSGNVRFELETLEGEVAPEGISIAPAIINIPNENPVKFTMVISVASTMTTGTYNLRIKATNEDSTIVRYVFITLEVENIEGNEPSFTIESDTEKLNIEQGNSGKVQITITPENGFSGNVRFELETLEGGVAPEGISIAPAIINIPNENPVKFTMVISVASTMTTGTYNLRIKATNEDSTIVRYVFITLEVENIEGNEPSFTIESDTEKLNIEQGNSGKVQITITPENGFSGNVRFELETLEGEVAPEGISIAPAIINIPNENPVKFTMVISVASTMTTGTYNLRIKATNEDSTIVRYVFIIIEVIGIQHTDYGFTIDLVDSNYFINNYYVIENASSVNTFIKITPKSDFNGIIKFTIVNQDNSTPTGFNIFPEEINIDTSDITNPIMFTIFNNSASSGNYVVKIVAISKDLSDKDIIRELFINIIVP